MEYTGYVYIAIAKAREQQRLQRGMEMTPVINWARSASAMKIDRCQTNINGTAKPKANTTTSSATPTASTAAPPTAGHQAVWSSA